MKPDVADTVEHIYDALLDDARLATLGAAFANLLGATSGWFPIIHLPTGTARVISPFNIPSGAAEPYQAYYNKIDPWIAAAMAGAADRTFLSDDHITARQFQQQEIFVDYVKPYFGNTTRLIGGFLPMGDEIAIIGMHRQDSLGAFPDEARHMMDRLIPPLRRLLAVRKGLDAANARTENLEATLDRVGHGILQCQADGKIIYANRTALMFLKKQGGFRGLLGGRFHTLDPTETNRLHHLIQRAASERSPSGGAMPVARVDGAAAYQIVVTPFRPPQGTRTALVMVRDTERPAPNLRLTIQSLYQLTNAETEVTMALVRGETPEEYAEARAISITTVRTQIRSILSKAGVRRQIDLVSMIAGLPPLGEPDERDR